LDSHQKHPPGKTIQGEEGKYPGRSWLKIHGLGRPLISKRDLIQAGEFKRNTYLMGEKRGGGNAGKNLGEEAIGPVILWKFDREEKSLRLISASPFP